MPQIACVTGAERGLGLALAREFLQNGFHVFACRYLTSESGLDRLREEYPDRLDIVPIDVSKLESVKEAAREIASRTDKIDILVNNAAIIGSMEDTILDDLDFEEILNVINVSGVGALRVASQLIRPILNSERKLIVNISSEAGSIGQCYRVAWYGYAMAKAAMNMQAAITHNRIRELGGQVLNLHPGWVKGHLTGRYTEEADLTPEESASHLIGIILNHRQYMADAPAFIDYLERPQQW